MAQDYPRKRPRAPHHSSFLNRARRAILQSIVKMEALALPSWVTGIRSSLWTAGALYSTIDNLTIWSKALATGKLPNGDLLLSEKLHEEQLKDGLGIANMGYGFVGYGGEAPGFEGWMGSTTTPPLQHTKVEGTIVVLTNLDAWHNFGTAGTLAVDVILKELFHGPKLFA